MRRAALTILLSAVCCVSAAGCSGGAGSSSSVSPTAPATAPAVPATPAPTAATSVTNAPAGREQQTSDVEADLGRVTTDLNAAGQDLQDGPTQATADTRG